MKVLLISSNQEYFPHRITPIGLLYLAAALRDKGFETRILDLMFSENPMEDIKTSILNFEPDIVGLSLRNIDIMITKGKSLLSYQLSCYHSIKESAKGIVILGGAGFTIAPLKIMELFQADFGIRGKADSSFPEFVDCIQKNSDYTKISGLIYRKGNNLIKNPVNNNSLIENFPFQAIDLISLKNYRKKRGFIGVFTRYSCTQQCIYCDEGALYGPVRLRHSQNVVSEIKYIHDNTGFRYFDFADALFNSPARQMLDVLKELAAAKLKIKFKVELNPVGQTEESVKLLKQAGCMGVDFTPDSGSDFMLEQLKKGFNTADVLKVAGLFAKHRIPYSAGFLLGGPGESIKTVCESIDLALQLPKVKLVYFTTGITIGGGNSEMESRVEADSILKTSDLFDIKYYLSDEFDERCAEKLLDVCNKVPHFYLSELFLSDRMNTIWRWADFLNLRPIWKYGKIPSYALKFLYPGKNIIQWNQEKRRFEVR